MFVGAIPKGINYTKDTIMARINQNNLANIRI